MVNKNYLHKYYNDNKGAQGNIEKFILPTLRYIQKNIISTTYYYSYVYENQKRGEEFSIENLLSIRDKLMAILMVEEYQETFEITMDGICQELQLGQEQFIIGPLENRVRALALLIVQNKGIIGPTQFDFKSAEGTTVPGEPVATFISNIAIEVLNEYNLIENHKDIQNIFRALISTMAFLIIFRIKTDWDV